MSDINVKELCAPVFNGEERIEDWWKQNESIISSIKEVTTDEEVIIWSACYYHYGMYLQNENYSKQSLQYIDKAIDIIERNKGQLNEQVYEDSLETMLETKSNILLHLDEYWKAYKIMSTLCFMKPSKEDYAIERKSLLRLSISKFINPMWIVLVVLWAVMMCEALITHTEFIPHFMWDIGFVVWIILLFIQFVAPSVINKIQQLMVSSKQRKSV